MSSFPMTRCFSPKTPGTFLTDNTALPYIRTMYLLDLLNNLQFTTDIPGLDRRLPKDFTLTVLVDDWCKEDRCVNSASVKQYADYLRCVLFVAGCADPIVIPHGGQYYVAFQEAAIVKAKASLDRFKEKNGKKLQRFISNVHKGKYFNSLFALDPVKGSMAVALQLTVTCVPIWGAYTLIKWLYLQFF